MVYQMSWVIQIFIGSLYLHSRYQKHASETKKHDTDGPFLFDFGHGFLMLVVYCEYTGIKYLLIIIEMFPVIQTALTLQAS